MSYIHCAQAAMQGRWLVIEGIDMAPPDVLAALAPLMEARQLHIPQRAQQTAAASGFQLIATVTTNPGPHQQISMSPMLQISW